MPLRFEDCTLDTATREFRRGGELIPLEPQVFDLLVYVIRNRDRVVSKDDLIEAVWGGRIVSESSLTTRLNAARKAIGDSGEEQRLIRTVARKGIRFVGTVMEGQPAAAPVEATPSDPPALALPDKPSIAVLPFQNMSGDPEQEYFCDGMVEEIITALSRFRRIFVIARNSTFTYKGRAVDVKQVARELGVRYVLEGSVRKNGDKVRITGQLIDGTSGAHLWADRFDGTLEDIFDLQDQVTMSVVGAIEPKLRQVEIERARRKPTENLDAYDHLLRAWAHFHPLTRDGNVQALVHLGRALTLDPHLDAAAGLAAWCYTFRRAQGWTTSVADDVREGCRFAHMVADGPREDATALAHAAHTFAYLGRDFDGARALIEQAIRINRNSFYVWQLDGWIRYYIGEPRKAIESFQRAYRLSPLDPLIGLTMAGFSSAYLSLGEYEEGLRWSRLAVKVSPRFVSSHLTLVALLVQTGRLAEAGAAAKAVLTLDPDFRVSEWVARGFLHQEQSQMRADAMRKAGLPE